MKISVAFLLFLATISISYAQKYVDTNDPDGDEIKSLLSKGNDLNAFGAADLKIGDFKGERGLLLGAYGGFIINRRFLFGVAGYGLVTKVEFDGVVPNQPIKSLDLHGGYGGVMIGGTIAPRELIHISVPIVLGAGSMEVTDDNFFINNPVDSEFTIENSVFFVLEPGIELEFNITQYFRLGAGATYRHVTGLELANVSNEELSGFNAIISFRFGRF